jgi:hypothetical protein
MPDEKVTFSKEGNIGFVTVNNPPVNALCQAVRAGIESGVHAGLPVCFGVSHAELTLMGEIDGRHYQKTKNPSAMYATCEECH